MRVLVISDIHANLAAFEAVLEDAAGKWDTIWCLGDVVGYGPDPNGCTSLLREHDHLCLSGNHDWAVLGRLDLDSFNREARLAIEWTQRNINEESRNYLEILPSLLLNEPFTLAHGSPRQPVWEYILDRGTAATNFGHFDTPYALVGHTHTPIIYEEVDSIRVHVHSPAYNKPLTLNGPRLIINPGSVGQPRDSDPRAAYALLDTDKMLWEHKRVAYPIEVTQEKMRQQQFPQRLINRLEHGW